MLRYQSFHQGWQQTTRWQSERSNKLDDWVTNCEIVASFMLLTVVIIHIFKKCVSCSLVVQIKYSYDRLNFALSFSNNPHRFLHVGTYLSKPP